jgi:uncharacterized protein YodC (DUF2158 family)
MDVKLIGTFVLINQGYGVLSSIYHNTDTTEPFPETCKRVGDHTTGLIISDSFDGFYKTVWFEPSQHVATDLEISKLADGSYKLHWYDSKNIYYHGIGFLRNNELVGSYWQYKILFPFSPVSLIDEKK